MVHTLSRTRPFDQALVVTIQDRLLEDLRASGVQILDVKPAHGSNAEYPTAGLYLRAWGFVVAFDDHGFKGTAVVRLMSKEIRDAASLGPQAELTENIVVFPKD
jgi:hypothetical protein